MNLEQIIESLTGITGKKYAYYNKLELVVETEDGYAYFNELYIDGNQIVLSTGKELHTEVSLEKLLSD